MARPEISPSKYRSITRFALWSLVMIVITGAAVRLTGSGLGCSDWPNCSADRFVPEREFHGLVEFVNRLFTGVVSVAVILAVLGSLFRSPRRRDLDWLAWGLVAGVIGQIVLGGITVLSGLKPQIVMAHFLLSMVLVLNAVVLDHRANAVVLDHRTNAVVLDHRARSATTGPGARDRATSPDRAWALAMAALAAVAVFAGTIVTASGPHAGDEDAPRLGVDLAGAARAHGAIVLCLCALTIAYLVVLFRRLASPDGGDLAARSLIRPVGMFAAILVVQAAIGYIQYFNDTPAAIVGLHIAGACAVWISVIRVVLVEHDCRLTNVSADRVPQLS